MPQAAQSFEEEGRRRPSRKGRDRETGPPSGKSDRDKGPLGGGQEPARGEVGPVSPRMTAEQEAPPVEKTASGPAPEAVAPPLEPVLTAQLEVTVAVHIDPVRSAEVAGLRYVSDQGPGIRRTRTGESFTYLEPDGRPLSDPAVLDRIKHIGIPPAWTDVWICPDPCGHIQATGRDARGRKQYRYHTRWRSVRDETKYDRLIAFGLALPAIRERVERDLGLPGLPRERVLATVVRLLETTLIRVGNEEYARKNNSFGLTTLRDGHVDIDGATVSFRFRGKSGKEHTISLEDRCLARIVKRCQDIPGQELFQYIDAEGQHRILGSADVNAYVREISGQDFTARDFRTWGGTVLAAATLEGFDRFETQTQAKKNIVQAIEAVASRLGNTRAICRKSYVHPAILDAYLEGTLLEGLRQVSAGAAEEANRWLEPEELAVLAFLEARLSRELDARSISVEVAGQSA